MRAAIVVWAALPLFALGCGESEKTGDGGVSRNIHDSGPGRDTDMGTDTAVDEELDLSLSLDESAVPAGTTVIYTVLLTDEDGESTAASGATITSDLEADLSLDSGTLTPTLAGTHVLTASLTLDGEELTASADLEVVAAAADWLDLTLAEPEVTAGDTLSFTITGEDAWGNSVDTTAVDLEADSTYVTVESDTARTTVVGTYSLTASQDGQSDTESWTVVPGAPDAVYLTLDEEDLEEGDTAEASVVVTDEYGNGTDAPWTITVEGTGEATVDGDEITFDQEGVFTITVTVDGTGIDDSVSLTIDSSGPLIIVDTPDRGSWTTEDRVEFAGTITDAVTGVTSLSIDGVDVSMSASGGFSEWVTLQHGVNIIESIAVDDDTPDPNETSDVRAVLQAADWGPTSTYMSEGLIIRLNEGPGGMDVLSELASEMIDPDAISSMMLGEVASGSCCWGLFSFSASVDAVDIGEVDVTLDTYSPYLRVTAVIHDITVDGSIGGTFSSGFDMTADSISVVIYLTPAVDSAGNITATADLTTVTVSGMVVEASGGIGVLEDIVEFFGVDVDGRVEDELTSAIESEVATTIPDMIEEAMSGIEVSQTMEMGDNTYTILAIPEDIDIDSIGMNVALKTWVGPDWVWEDTWGVSPPGPTLGDFGYPTFGETSGGTELALGVDFLNQLMYAMWAGGLLDTELTDEDLGIDVGLIGLVLPGLTDLTLVTSPTLPPAIVPHVDAEAGTDLAMQIGDMYVEIYDGPVSASTLYMELYVSAQIPLSMTASSDGDAIGVALGDPEVSVDVVSPAPSSPAAAGAEAAFELLLPVFLPEITGVLGEIPIPAFAGFGLEDVDTALVGADDSHLMISGDLSAE